MTNVTISIEEEDLKQARMVALQQGSSLNAAIREFVKSYIGNTRRYSQVTERILQRAEQSQFSSEGCEWTREDLYER
ncbi:MAG: hypothetical protein L3J70_05665 [Gammaproteobacteria bacterium]|nr:hypothetical protein [Gammaproteobacteria bacterium]